MEETGQRKQEKTNYSVIFLPPKIEKISGIKQ